MVTEVPLSKLLPPRNPARERRDVNRRFAAMLEAATFDGSNKRQASLKPPWYEDTAHEAAIYSHLARWKRGELKDPHSGSHPLVHAAWRCLAIAATETGNYNSSDDSTVPLIIYIASPYTIGDVARNVHVQIEAAHRILDLGHCPVVPLLSHFLHLHRQRNYQDWIDLDLAIIPRCDVLLRLPGESKGADNEVKHANNTGVKVFTGWSELESFLASEMREVYKEPADQAKNREELINEAIDLFRRDRLVRREPLAVRVNGEWKDL